MIQLIQNIINGLIIGGTYAMMGIGLTLIFGVMNVVNFAHGEFYMLGAFFLFTTFGILHIGYVPSIILSLVFVAVFALVVERFLLRRMRDKPLDNGMILTIGLSILMQNVALLIWGGTPKNISLGMSMSSIQIGAIVVTPVRLIIAVIAIVVILLFGLFLQKTKLGTAVRATFQDREMASAVGININHIYGLTFIAGSLMAALAGILLAPIYVLLPTMGDQVNAKAFAVAITGGLGNFPGAIIAGLLLGVAESLGSAYISSGYKDAIGFILIVIVLVTKPKWLTGDN
ncbi:MAG: ABC transporter permease [Desulfosporosinus sp. BRH_c37]|nr:MAG: ABC transporter permease [Desulfosporosinus sp. BRH_c37]